LLSIWVDQTFFFGKLCCCEQVNTNCFVIWTTIFKCKIKVCTVMFIFFKYTLIMSVQSFNTLQLFFINYLLIKHVFKYDSRVRKSCVKTQSDFGVVGTVSCLFVWLVIKNINCSLFWTIPSGKEQCSEIKKRD
jgi:hypothetical protein